MVFSTVFYMQSTVFSRQQRIHDVHQAKFHGFGEHSIVGALLDLLGLFAICAWFLASETKLTYSNFDSQSPIPKPAFKNEEEKQLYMSGKQLERNVTLQRGFITKSSESKESDTRGSPSRRVSLSARLGMYLFPHTLLFVLFFVFKSSSLSPICRVAASLDFVCGRAK
jgi:hypothetical protein